MAHRRPALPRMVPRPASTTTSALGGIREIEGVPPGTPGGTPSISLVVDAGLRTIIYVGDPVSGNGMAAMTNGDKGEEVCNALRQRVATAYGWR